MQNPEDRIENFFGQTRAEVESIAQERLEALLEKLKTAHPKIQAEYKNVPDKYKRLFLDVHFADKVPVKKAIKDTCLSCCCWQREEITHCTVRQCGLWKLRPYQEK